MDFSALTPSHKIQWAQLLALCFNRSQDDMLALITWLYQMGDIVAWGAWDGETLLAQYTSLLRRLCYQGVELSAGMSINMAVHPNYRGQGLVKKVSAPVYDEIAQRGALLGLGFSNAEGVKVDKHSKSYAYQVVGQMHSLLSFLTKRSAPQLELQEFLPLELTFRDAPIQSNLIHFDKPAQSFAVRFGAHPFRDYKYGLCYEHQSLIGIVVYREVERLGLKGVSLMDAQGNNLQELIASWGNSIHAQGKQFIHSLASPESYLAQALRKHYRTVHLPYTRTPYFLTVRPLKHDIGVGFGNFKLWDFVGGDIL